MRTLALTPALLALLGCTMSAPPTSTPVKEQRDDLTRAHIGQTVAVGGPKVTPLAVLEDSRCPMNVRCVRAGRVRISARVDLGRGSKMLELTQGTPVSVADGTLELVEVLPDRSADRATPSSDYRFGVRFMGGL